MHRRLRCDFTESVSCLDHVQEASRAAPPPRSVCVPGTHGEAIREAVREATRWLR